MRKRQVLRVGGLLLVHYWIGMMNEIPIRPAVKGSMLGGLPLLRVITETCRTLRLLGRHSPQSTLVALSNEGRMMGLPIYF
jgi:hypothetical protein